MRARGATHAAHKGAASYAAGWLYKEGSVATRHVVAAIPKATGMKAKEGTIQCSCHKWHTSLQPYMYNVRLRSRTPSPCRSKRPCTRLQAW